MLDTAFFIAMLNVVMLNVVMLNVSMLNVIAPVLAQLSKCETDQECF
jgi:hypothetical protein